MTAAAQRLLVLNVGMRDCLFVCKSFACRLFLAGVETSRCFLNAEKNLLLLEFYDRRAVFPVTEDGLEKVYAKYILKQLCYLNNLRNIHLAWDMKSWKIYSTCLENVCGSGTNQTLTLCPVRLKK